MIVQVVPTVLACQDEIRVASRDFSDDRSIGFRLEQETRRKKALSHYLITFINNCAQNTFNYYFFSQTAHNPSAIIDTHTSLLPPT